MRAQAEPYNGYTLFSPNNSRNTYLVNMSNTVVHSWNHTRNGGYSSYLLADGHALRTAQVNNATFNAGGAQGAVQEADWNGALVWEFTYSNNQHHAHHDIEPMPNGNLLIIAWELKTAAQARQAGYSRNVALWPDHIIEVEPAGTNGGTIIWEWHAWDHLIQDYDATKDNYGVVADHPELFDINMSAGVGPQGGDWMHVNGISYNPERDEIVFSSHTLDEVYVIDHSTTTAEAASHAGGNRGKGGDILYRWGKPANYDAPGAQYFNVVHCAVWIPEGLPGEGHIMVFNNREGQGTSQIVELNLPYDEMGNYIRAAGSAFGPTIPFWSYTAAGFYSNHLGGCQRLPNGNTIIAESTSGYLFEVNTAGVVQWSYARGGEIARVLRYAIDFPGVYALNPVSAGDVVINEFLASNLATVADQNGEYDDWIEFRNNSTREISLWGFFLSDELSSPTQWAFPDTSIAVGGYLIVWADEDADQDGLHANFQLPDETVRIVLRSPNQAILDTTNSGGQTADRSYGRYPNGSGAFTLMTPSFAAENVADIPVTPGEIVINEYLAVNDTTIADQNGEYDDWIEIRNNTTREISLNGFYLSDALDNPTPWTFPDTTIAAGGYLIVWADADAEQRGLHANFQLPSDVIRIVLRNSDRTILDSAASEAQTADRSYGRFPDGTGRFIAMTPSFSVANINDVSNAAPIDAYLPTRTELQQNYPNPFNSYTRIAFTLAASAEVVLSIFDVLGRQVIILTSGVMPAGQHETVWNGRDDRGNPVNSGVYFYTLRTGTFAQTRKTVLLK